MQIGDFKKFTYGITVSAKHCVIYDVYMIDINEHRIELSDSFGMVIGTIDVDQLNDIEIFGYDENDRIISLGDLNEL